MSGAPDASLPSAYAHCRAVARQQAKNFYWAFRALPRHKSDAMCAVYAFMRQADDLADDESLSLPARREAMAAWTAAWHRSHQEPTSDLVFRALNDTQQRFGIPDTLLEQLVQGTTMDLEPELEGTVRLVGAAGESFLGYRDFDALYRYCYLVASVVGLVTIRIFGYRDMRAEKLAEQTGIAFQLTNILRDLREDAERGRIYLPANELARAGLSPGQFGAMATGSAPPDARLLALLRRELDRAEGFYRARAELLPLIDADARPAMRVLIGIYHRLLQRLAVSPAEVLRTRVSVPTAEKLAVLAWGAAEAALVRLR